MPGKGPVLANEIGQWVAAQAQRSVIAAKTAFFSGAVIAANLLGNYCLKRGLFDIGVLESWSPVPYILAFARPWIVVGVLAMIAWLVLRLLLFSWADLSYVLPVTSLSYSLSAAAGVVLLKESVSGIHWAGICLITVGVALAACTYPDTTEGQLEQKEAG